MTVRQGFLSVVVTLAILTCAVPARCDQAPAPALVTSVPSGGTLSVERLACMSPGELEQLYRRSAPGPIPEGFWRGQAIYCPDAFLAGPRSRATNFLWRGKRFCAADGTLVNQWRGVRAIRARVYEGPSSLDGRPSIILDYQGMSYVWNDVRDEIREVCPGVYLGLMYRRRCPCPRFEMFFALEPADTCRSVPHGLVDDVP
jgi:hypothetical protein